MRTDTPPVIHLKDYRPASHLIDDVQLDFLLHPKATKITSNLKLRPNPASSEAPDRLVLDGENIKLKSVKLDGKFLKADTQYEVTPETLIIHEVPKRAFS